MGTNLRMTFDTPVTQVDTTTPLYALGEKRFENLGDQEGIKCFRYYKLSTTTTAGNALVTDTADATGMTVKELNTAGRLPVGIAMATVASVASTTYVWVQTEGVYDTALVDSGVAAGDRLTHKNANGTLKASASAGDGICGEALAAYNAAGTPIRLRS